MFFKTTSGALVNLGGVRLFYIRALSDRSSLVAQWDDTFEKELAWFNTRDDAEKALRDIEDWFIRHGRFILEG